MTKISIQPRGTIRQGIYTLFQKIEEENEKQKP